MTIIVPPGPPRKSPDIDSKTCLKLVINALLSARSKAESRVVELERTDENKLTQVYRGEIICALERILEENRSVFRIMRAGYTLKTAAKPATLLTKYSEPVYQWQQWKEIPEDKPIILALLDGFDNWCEAQVHKRTITLKNLSEQSRQKVLDTVAAIYQQFELTSNPKVSIRWVVGSESGNYEARQLAIEFLENKEVVLGHKFHYEGAGHIEIEIDIKEFFRIRDELLGLYAPVTDGEEGPSQDPAPTSDSSSFASMKDLKWQDITIQFLDGLTAKISVNDTSLTVDFRQMGFEDARKRLPNTQWYLLRLLAERGGQISWEESEASDNIKKKKQLLSDTLKTFFHIDDDPFYPYREQKAYRTKFKLKAEAD